MWSSRSRKCFDLNSLIISLISLTSGSLAELLICGMVFPGPGFLFPVPALHKLGHKLQPTEILLECFGIEYVSGIEISAVLRVYF